MNNQTNKLLPANVLLDRLPDPDYIQEWTQLTEKELVIESNYTELSVVMFRLNNEWFALNTAFFVEVAALRQAHRIPHRSNSFLLGFVNLRGQMYVCISMYQLLGLPSGIDLSSKASSEPSMRLLALKKDNAKFTFQVNEVFGVYRCNFSTLQTPPVTISKLKDNYLKGIFKWKNFNVALLDEDSIFKNLQRRICERK